MIEPLFAERLLTPEEYLAAEEAAEVKHEYLGGRVYAFAGASLDHDRLAANLAFRLRSRLGEGPCEVFGSDVLVRASEDVYYYPDLTVCCEFTEDETRVISRPRVVVEIASPTTKRIDEGEKAHAYWRVPSIETYVLVEQDVLRVRVLRRGADYWEPELLTELTDRLRLEGLGFETTLAEIYARTRLAKQA